MKIIKPITITPEMVISNAPSIHSDWNSTTSYSLGDKRIYNNIVYESLINSNLNFVPSDNPEKWLSTGASNKTAILDQSYTSQTINPTGNLIFEISPEQVVGSLAILNLDGTYLTIEQLDGTIVVYNRTVNLYANTVVNWYDYFFEGFDQLKDVVITDLIPIGDLTLKITVSGSSTKTGVIITGSAVDVGGTQYGLNFGVKDYSVKEEDDFGNIVFVERNYAKRLDATTMIPNTSIRKTFSLLAQLRAKPTVFIPTEEEGYDALITYGFLYDWNIEIPYPTSSLLRLDIKGLT